MNETSSVEPDWSQEKPDFLTIGRHLAGFHVEHVELPTECERVVSALRASHDNGGAELACFRLPPDRLLDWYTSHNRWVFDGLADTLLSHPTMHSWLLDRLSAGDGFESKLVGESQFLFDGRLAQMLFAGGAYHRSIGDGREEKEQAARFCDAMFQLRYADISFAASYEAWTPWFHGIAWDATFMVLDKRTRLLWILAVTDTD